MAEEQRKVRFGLYLYCELSQASESFVAFIDSAQVTTRERERERERERLGQVRIITS
jgi:hypothetical protein